MRPCEYNSRCEYVQLCAPPSRRPARPLSRRPSHACALHTHLIETLHALPPEAPPACLDLEVLLIRLIRVRIRVPLFHRLLVAGLLELVLHVEGLVAVDELVAGRMRHLVARLGLDRAVD